MSISEVYDFTFIPKAEFLNNMAVVQSTIWEAR